jgi:hypothetical protein
MKIICRIKNKPKRYESTKYSILKYNLRWGGCTVNGKIMYVESITIPGKVILVSLG